MLKIRLKNIRLQHIRTWERNIDSHKPRSTSTELTLQFHTSSKHGFGIKQHWDETDIYDLYKICVSNGYCGMNMSPVTICNCIIEGLSRRIRMHRRWITLGNSPEFLLWENIRCMCLHWDAKTWIFQSFFLKKYILEFFLSQITHRFNILHINHMYISFLYLKIGAKNR